MAKEKEKKEFDATIYGLMQVRKKKAKKRGRQIAKKKARKTTPKKVKGGNKMGDK